MHYPTNRLKALLTGATAITLLSVSGPSAASPLQLQITGNGSPALPLYVAVYPASAERWEGEPILRLRSMLPESDVAEIGLDIPPGEYAIRAFVDLDGDGKLDLNTRGRPTEPYASSLSPNRSRRSQRFKHAVITLSADQPSVSLDLTYPRKSGY